MAEAWGRTFGTRALENVGKPFFSLSEQIKNQIFVQKNIFSLRGGPKEKKNDFGRFK